MRMLVTLEFADAGTKSGTHQVLIIGRGTDNLQAGDIGLSRDRRNRRENLGFRKGTQSCKWAEALTGRFRQPASHHPGTADCVYD